MNADRKDQDTEKELARLHIRWMIRRDLPEVLRIEQASFAHPWKEADFFLCLRERNCIGMTAEQGEKVVGFMIYELHKARLRLLNFAVHPCFRRAGVGKHMATKLVNKLSNHRRTRIDLELRETNVAAQLFFRAQGFKATQVLRSFYADSGEDAIVMEYRIADELAETRTHRVNRIAQ